MTQRRPWGKMWTLVSGKTFWFKFLWVRGRTSLQAHKDRTEWHFGLYKVHPMEKHRLAHGAFFEFAKGRRVEEDDIIRYEDDYGRAGERVVLVSGGFDPLHIGHVRMFEDAKKLGDRLVVVTNSDEWLKRKKGKSFMRQEDRKEMIEAIDCVDEVFVLESNVDHVCEALEKYKPNVFANGGDRRNAEDIPEAKICEELGIEMIFEVGGGKIRSSSELLDEYAK